MPCLARAPPRQAGALLDMGAYEYTALDGGGKERKGVLEADTPRQIRQQLREKGWAPLAVVEVQQREARGARHRSFFQPRISAVDLALITRQFATLVRSGLPVEEALQALSRQTARPRLKSMMMAVRSRVMEGHTLASSLEDFPHVFPDLYRATVAAGEQSGYLDSVLERLADYTETRQTLQQKTTLALIYPLLVLVVSLLVVALLMVYVVPQIVQVFEGIGQKLPVLTRALIAVSDFTRSYGLWMLIALVIAVVLAPGARPLHRALRAHAEHSDRQRRAGAGGAAHLGERGEQRAHARGGGRGGAARARGRGAAHGARTQRLFSAHDHPPHRERRGERQIGRDAGARGRFAGARDGGAHHHHHRIVRSAADSHHGRHGARDRAGHSAADFRS